MVPQLITGRALRFPVVSVRQVNTYQWLLYQLFDTKFVHVFILCRNLCLEEQWVSFPTGCRDAIETTQVFKS
jgi:hypothetical protein